MGKLKLLCEIIDQKIKSEVDTQKYNEASEKMVLSVKEFVNFQTLKSLAQIKGIIDLEDSMYIYGALGEWDKQTLGTKICLTKLHADLLKAKMQGKL